MKLDHLGLHVSQFASSSYASIDDINYRTHTKRTPRADFTRSETCSGVTIGKGTSSERCAATHETAARKATRGSTEKMANGELSTSRKCCHSSFFVNEGNIAYQVCQSDSDREGVPFDCQDSAGICFRPGVSPGGCSAA